MTWGRGDWLADRAKRREWLRTIALSGLAEQLLKTPATAREAIGCVLDELFEDDLPIAAATVTRRVKEDVARIDDHLRMRFAAGKKACKRFESLALVLSDGAPYELHLILVNAPLSGDWIRAIAWRDTECLGLTLLDELLPRVPKAQHKNADYIVPLAHAAFVVHEALRGRGASYWKPAREATVIYAGGDFLPVPMT